MKRSKRSGESQRVNRLAWVVASLSCEIRSDVAEPRSALANRTPPVTAAAWSHSSWVGGVRGARAATDVTRGHADTARQLAQVIRERASDAICTSQSLVPPYLLSSRVAWSWTRSSRISDYRRGRTSC